MQQLPIKIFDADLIVRFSAKPAFKLDDSIPELRKSTMLPYGTLALILGGALSAATAHLVCIFLGAPAYRFLGAGEKWHAPLKLEKPDPP